MGGDVIGVVFFCLSIMVRYVDRGFPLKKRLFIDGDGGVASIHNWDSTTHSPLAVVGRYSGAH